jgi:hypothetical protein
MRACRRTASSTTADVGSDVSTVTVERTRTYFGRIRRLKVVIDGRTAGSLRFGEAQVFPVAEGQHTVMTKMDVFKSPVVQVSVANEADVRLIADLPHVAPFRFRFSLVRQILGKPALSLTVAASE